MNEAKEEILQRIRGALKDVPDNEDWSDESVTRTYQQSGTTDARENLQLFAERVRDYKAEVKVIHSGEIKSVVAEACKGQEVQKLVVPPGVPQEWLPEDVDILQDEPELLTHKQLDESDGVITGCSLAIAQTGTIVLDGGKTQGRRALTLLPDYHLCIVFADQIVGIVPEAFEQLDTKIKQSGPPITFISGPSATSDIELSRVEGVHGPRRLEVLVVKG